MRDLGPISSLSPSLSACLCLSVSVSLSLFIHCNPGSLHLEPYALPFTGSYTHSFPCYNFVHTLSPCALPSSLHALSLNPCTLPSSLCTHSMCTPFHALCPLLSLLHALPQCALPSSLTMHFLSCSIMH